MRALLEIGIKECVREDTRWRRSLQQAALLVWSEWIRYGFLILLKQQCTQWYPAKGVFKAYAPITVGFEPLGCACVRCYTEQLVNFFAHSGVF